MRTGMIRSGLAIGLVAAVAWGGTNAPGQGKQPDDAAVARTRKQVQMLDDLYKTTIVLVTENYVEETSDLAAGAAFQKVFEAMRQKGWHDVRLLDATGEPYNEKNVARDAFEKAAIAALQSGQATYEQVETRDGKRYLRMATTIPVVMKKCTMCHPVYEKAKPGAAIGALSYTLAVE
jgi:hypothetical protein